MNPVIKEMYRVLKVLSGRLNGYYLTGGTALSLFYFQHRESYDLDFFTKEFSRKRIEDIIKGLSVDIDKKISLIGEESREDKAKMLMYSYDVGKEVLKIDFVEDLYKLIKPPRIIDGIPVLEKEDIYLRKIFAACGSYAKINEIGNKEFKGGRQEAKDFFDLYFLSTTFMPLSKFAVRYCIPGQIESIVVWYRTYDRMAIKLGLLDINTDKKINFREMERHFRYEIGQMIEKGF
ncbi:MAG: nucleotidyl transferase AbiEii/AbiGii toxin family protein [Candidatus Omnitrophota bacterium]